MKKKTVRLSVDDIYTIYKILMVLSLDLHEALSRDKENLELGLWYTQFAGGLRKIGDTLMTMNQIDMQFMSVEPSLTQYVENIIHGREWLENGWAKESTLKYVEEIFRPLKKKLRESEKELEEAIKGENDVER